MQAWSYPNEHQQAVSTPIQPPQRTTTVHNLGSAATKPSQFQTLLARLGMSGVSESGGARRRKLQSVQHNASDERREQRMR
jgi:hypothetical protein